MRGNFLAQSRRARADESATAEESSKHQRISSLTAALGVVLSLPALVLSLVTYLDQRESEHKAGLEAASKVFWYWNFDTEGEKLLSVTVENRGLTPAYRTALIVKDKKSGRIKYGYDFDLAKACSKSSYEFTGKHPEAGVDAGNADTELIFYDSIGRLWKSTSKEGATLISGVNESLHVHTFDAAKKWKLPFKDADLDNCG
ncbi:hypothetical protein AB0G35_29335 [Streptomyces sp. NPDC021749]|uniref:hypothetical protein n=1 Tax=Streptomyces sp. NPDC021749 TaxID=3154905 RepID=UPI0033EB26E4